MKNKKQSEFDKFSKISDFEELKKEDLLKLKGGVRPDDEDGGKWTNSSTGYTTYTETAPSPKYDTSSDSLNDTKWDA